MNNIYAKLLIEYSDALISLQDKGEDKAFRGGIYCRACKMIHGRCPDAVYGFTVAAKITGEEKYLTAAKEVFDYGENMLCKDGALYNDAQAEWRCTTTFHAIAVAEALRSGKDLFDEQTKEKFTKRLLGMAEWLYVNLDEFNPAHINYTATTALALALVGKDFGIEKYVKQAKHLAEYAMKHFTENGIMFGECTPHNALSEKKCNGIDIGYNVEESIPSLIKYAYEVNDKPLIDELEKIMLKNLDFMFPDGGWDNTFGDRNYKWTYWGSRTSDGCMPGCLLLAERNPVFAEASYRNMVLLDKCSKDGFLYGGPDYEKHGEHPCTHHGFEHINAIAFAVENIDEKFLKPQGVLLPVEKGDFSKYYPECRTYRFSKGDYISTITDCDFNMRNVHAAGGTLTALYNKKIGPMIMASSNLYVLLEPTNMQQCLDRDTHRALTPRIIVNKDQEYSSPFYLKAEVSYKEEDGNEIVEVKAGVTDRWVTKDLEGYNPTVKYTINANGVNIKITKMGEGKFILPLINGKCETLIGMEEKCEEIFFLVGGFIANEHTYSPDGNGNLELFIHA